MLFVIEGLPRTGKTTIAKDISKRLGMMHDDSRPPDGVDIDSFVFGKCELHKCMDFANIDLIMDRQLPSSYAYSVLYRGKSDRRFLEYDKQIPCVYFYLRTYDHDRISESTQKDGYHAAVHSSAHLQTLHAIIENFIYGSANPSYTIDLPNNPTQVDFDLAREQIIYIINQLRPGWDKYFMQHAQIAAKRSTCLSRHVGSVLVEDNRIIGVGYSGPPRGAPHCNECSRRDSKSGEMLHDSRAVHAEVNAVLNATKIPQNASLYCTTQPCFECTKMLINANVKRIIYRDPYPDNKRDQLVAETGIEVIQL